LRASCSTSSAHQVLYVPGDTVFNESYATAVERIGGAMWLQREAGEAARGEYAQFDAQRQGFRAAGAPRAVRSTQVYESPEAKAGDWARVEVMKQAAMADFRERYAKLKAGWTGPRQNAYDGWVARANNAAFGAQGAYDDLVPAFETLFERQGRDWPRFYTEVKRIAALPSSEERRSALQVATGILQTRSSPSKDNKEIHGA
jgi:predicted aminopeptidase